MAGAHHRSRRRPQFTTTVVVAVTVLLGVTATALVVRGDAATACQDDLDLTVATPPSLTPPLGAVVATVNDRASLIGERCLRVDLVPRESAEVLEDLADGPGERQPVPDVWIPESVDWLAIARSSARAASRLPAAAPAIASTPVVIASPAPVATAAGWPE
nr:substrate-binding domain-containing protein [Micromonospora sp. DSM 115978]